MLETRAAPAHAGELRRKSAGVLTGDVVGYSRMVAEDVEGTVAALNQARRIAAGAVREAGGRLVDFTG